MVNGTAPVLQTTGSDFGKALRVKAEALQGDYDRLRQIIARAEYDLERLKTYAEHMNELLKIEGENPVRLVDGSSGTGFAKPGNRAKNMPPRKSVFEGMSIGRAIERVLSTAPGAIHADVLVRAIYDVKTKEELNIAKRSLVSTARTGAKKRLWHALPGNRYQAKSAQRELAAT